MIAHEIVTAASSGIDLNSYPLLNFFGGLAVLLITLLTWVIGRRAPPQPPEPEQGPVRVHGVGGIDFYPDGIFVTALDQVKRLATATEALVVTSQALSELREEFAQRLSATRHDQSNKMMEQTKSFERDLEALETRLREAENLLGIVDDRVRTLMRLPPGRSRGGG